MLDTHRQWQTAPARPPRQRGYSPRQRANQRQRGSGPRQRGSGKTLMLLGRSTAKGELNKGQMTAADAEAVEAAKKRKAAALATNVTRGASPGSAGNGKSPVVSPVGKSPVKV